jgi:hypothetical protein
MLLWGIGFLLSVAGLGLSIVALFFEMRVLLCR